MNTCPNCGKVAGLHSSILQGCMCQYSMQAPAQRTWVGLSPADRGKCLSAGDAHGWIGVMEATEARLKELNT
jgi:hypothetical protein